MAFATSSTAFGIKPANSGSPFGIQPTQGVGTSTSQPPPQLPSLFGGSTQAQNQSQPQVQNLSVPGSSLGQQPPLQQQHPPAGGLFSSGAWGSSTTGSANPSTQPAQNTFGTWGQLGNQTQTVNLPQSSTGFGGGIFGNPGNQQQSQPQIGLRGSITPSNPNQSIFSQPSSSTFGVPQQQLPMPSFTRTTKFNDLPPQIQKIFENVDTHIQGQIQVSKELKARSLSEEPTKGAELTRKVHNDLVNTMITLQADKALAEELSSKVEQSVQDTIVTTRVIDAFRNPQQNGGYLKDHVNFPLEFFTRAADEIRQKLQWYKTTIEQIERRLASAQTQAQYNPQAITTTLQAQNATFVALAAKTAELDAELQKLKSLYRERFKAITGSARDPFSEHDRRSGDGGMLTGIGTLNLST